MIIHRGLCLSIFIKSWVERKTVVEKCAQTNHNTERNVKQSPFKILGGFTWHGQQLESLVQILVLTVTFPPMTERGKSTQVSVCNEIYSNLNSQTNNLFSTADSYLRSYLIILSTPWFVVHLGSTGACPQLWQTADHKGHPSWLPRPLLAWRPFQPLGSFCYRSHHHGSEQKKQQQSIL